VAQFLGAAYILAHAEMNVKRVEKLPKLKIILH